MAVSAGNSIPLPRRSHQGTERITKAAVVFQLLCIFQTWSPCLRCCLFHLPKCYLGGLPSQLLVLSPCSELFWHAVCMSHWQVLWYLCDHGCRAPSKFPEHRVPNPSFYSLNRRFHLVKTLPDVSYKFSFSNSKRESLTHNPSSLHTLLWFIKPPYL